MNKKYGITIVKTADIEVDVAEVQSWLTVNWPEKLDLSLADQVEFYVSTVEGNGLDVCFDRELLIYPISDSHVGTVEIEVCVYCGSPRLTQDATVDTLTGEVRNIYDGVFCRDCENESKATSTVQVGMDFNVDTDFWKET